MKQKLLKSFLLLCAFIVGSIAWADEVTYDFTNIEGFDTWTTSYGEHVVEYDAATVTFTSANRQTGTITNQPVTKGQPVSLVMKGTKTISAASFTCTQWGTKAQTITLHYSKDGGENYTSTGVTSTNFTISSTNLPSGTNAVKITFSSTSNQVGIASATITYADADEPDTKVETFSYEDHQGKGKIDSGSSYTMWGIDVSITNDKFYGSTVNPCAYFYGYGDIGTGTTTITPHNGATITKVEIMTYDTDHNGWQIIGTEDPGEITASVGTVTANNEDKTKATVTTWTGSASEQFTITNTRTIAWSSIKVYYTGGLPKCATPVISGETSFITYSTVSISCETEGATIQYSTTTDGVNYTAYQTYTGPFQVSQSTMVKAQATKEHMVPSDEAYKAFVQHDVTPNIRYFISSHVTNPFTGPEFLQLEDALVTYKNGNTAYIEDAYGAIMLYQCVGDDLAAGDKINGYMKVTGYNPSYNGLPEITAFELVEGYNKTSDNTVTPTVVTIAQLTGGAEDDPYDMYLSKYIKIVDATVTSAFASKNCTIEQSGKTIILRDQNSPAILTSTKDDIVTVTGFVSIYNTDKQISVYEQSQIEVAVPTVPTLTVSKTSLTGFTYTEGDGPSAEQSFEVTGTNLTGDVTLDLGEPSYYEISVSAGTGYATKLVLNKAEANPKTIYVRLKAGLDKNESYSGTITITSEGAEAKTITLGGSVTEYVPDYAELPFEFNGVRADIEKINGLTQNGIGTDYNSSSAPTTQLKFDTTGDYIILKINKAPGTLVFDIKGNTFSKGKFTVQTSADGKEYTVLKTYTELGTTQTELFTLTSDVRYIKWIYTEKVNGNVGLGNIKVVDWANETATIGEAGYATYVTKHNVSFPAGVEASIATEVNTKLGYIATTEVTAVPKGTPVLLKGKADTYTLIPAAQSELSDVTGNLLKISDGKVQGSSTIYILAKPAEGKVAFYPTKEGTRIKEGKAYLEIPGSAGVKAFYFDGDAETAIANVNVNDNDNKTAIYNVAGQRLSKMQKGINIVNGKKVLK